MQVQQVIERIKSDFRSDPEMGRACMAVIKFFARQEPALLRQITFGTISRAAGYQTPLDGLAIAQYLSSDRINLLEKSFSLIVNDEEYEISAAEVALAVKQKILFHPDLGEPIENFEQSLHLFFTISNETKVSLEQIVQ